MCQNLQINALKIELDAKIIAELMTNSSNSNAVNSAMVADSRLLISQVSQVKVTHCYQETNRCADGLARVGNKQIDADIMYYNTPPPCLRDYYLSDLYGLCHVRLCPNSDVAAFLF